MGDGFWDWIENRSKVQFYAIFFFTWIALHWQTWVVLFFVSEERISVLHQGTTKLDYIKEYCNLFLPSTYPGSANEKYWINFVICVIVSYAVAYIAVWFIPKLVLLPAYIKEREHEFAKHSIDEENEEKYQNQRKKTVQAEAAVAQEQVKVAQARKTTAKIDESVLWADEFTEFKKNALYPKFDQVISSIYEHGGQIRPDYVSDDDFDVDTDILSYSHTSNLVKLDYNKNHIELLEKGKYFVSEYQKEKNRPKG